MFLNLIEKFVFCAKEQFARYMTPALRASTESWDIVRDQLLNFINEDRYTPILQEEIKFLQSFSQKTKESNLKEDLKEGSRGHYIDVTAFNKLYKDFVDFRSTKETLVKDFLGKVCVKS